MEKLSYIPFSKNDDLEYTPDVFRNPEEVIELVDNKLGNLVNRRYPNLIEYEYKGQTTNKFGK